MSSTPTRQLLGLPQVGLASYSMFMCLYQPNSRQASQPNGRPAAKPAHCFKGKHVRAPQGASSLMIGTWRQPQGFPLMLLASRLLYSLLPASLQLSTAACHWIALFFALIVNLICMFRCRCCYGCCCRLATAAVAAAATVTGRQSPTRVRQYTRPRWLAS